MTFEEWFLDNFKPHSWMFSKESIQKAFEDGVVEGLKQQADREWVGLTDEEVLALWAFTAMTGKGWLDLYRMAEDKLREKNT